MNRNVGPHCDVLFYCVVVVIFDSSSFKVL